MDNLSKAKITARERLNSLPPKEAQKLIGRVLGVTDLKPDLSVEIDWDDLPAPIDFNGDYNKQNEKNS